MPLDIGWAISLSMTGIIVTVGVLSIINIFVIKLTSIRIRNQFFINFGASHNEMSKFEITVTRSI